MKDNPTSVLVVGPNFSVRRMFRNKNYHVFEEKFPQSPDIVVFTGGPDISPKLYNQVKLPTTVGINKDRDMEEKAIFQRYPMSLKVGICRGAQLLNVLSGGNLYQHVDNHSNRTHDCIDLLNKKIVKLNSSHHQMMVPSVDADVMCITNQRTYHASRPRPTEIPYDPEVIWYEKTKSLCFQPHPEYSQTGSIFSETERYFFDLIRYFMWDKDNKPKLLEKERKVG